MDRFLIIALAGLALLTSCRDTQPPSVTTQEAKYITASSATLTAVVSSDGGSSVIVRGFCWGTSPLPTLENAHSQSGMGLGLFTHELTGLEHGTRYYVRSYAINSEGTTYGNQVEFTTTQPLGYLMVGTSQYELSWGILEYWGQVEDFYGGFSHNLDLTLFSSGVRAVERDGIIREFWGRGHYLYFEILTDSPVRLSDGVYQMNTTWEVFTYTDSSHYIVGLDFETGDWQGGDFITGGLTVSSAGAHYTLSFAGENSHGLPVSMSFAGPLRYYDFTPFLAKSTQANRPKPPGRRFGPRE